MYNHKNGITLRKVEKSDLPTMLNLKRESWWGTHGSSIINEQDQETWYCNLPSNCLVLAGENRADESTEKFLGVCIISEIDWVARSANISGSVIKDKRSMELCSRAFEAGLDFAFEMLNLMRLNAEVAEYNYPAQQIEIQHLGFVIEGVRRFSIFKSGKYYNSILLGLLRSEWKQSKRVFEMAGSCNENFDHHLAYNMSCRSKKNFGW